jgi:hypothetical protein
MKPIEFFQEFVHFLKPHKTRATGPCFVSACLFRFFSKIEDSPNILHFFLPILEEVFEYPPKTKKGVSPFFKMSSNQEESWQHGTIDHRAPWLIYSVLNTIGAIACLTYGMSILVQKKRLRKGAYDIGLLELLSGCLVMSIVCLTQCWANIAGQTQRFQWGFVGCQTEALGHIVAIQVQFLAITTIALYAYKTIKKSATETFSSSPAISVDKALWLFGLTWLYCILGTSITYSYSDLVLLPGGTYCFPAFRSPMLLWVASSMVVCLTLTCLLYWQTFRISNAAAEVAATNGTFSLQERTREAARRTFVLVLIFLFGWGMAVVSCVYAWWTGDITQEYEIAVGVLGSLHSIFVPIVYGQPKGREVRRLLLRIFFCSKCCQKCCPEFEVRTTKRGERTVGTRYVSPPNDRRSTRKSSTNSNKDSPHQKPLQKPAEEEVIEREKKWTLSPISPVFSTSESPPSSPSPLPTFSNEDEKQLLQQVTNDSVKQPKIQVVSNVATEKQPKIQVAWSSS